MWTLAQATAMARDLQKRFQRALIPPKEKSLTHAENLALLERYWKVEYRHRDILSARNMRRSLERAIEFMGDMPLATTPQDEIQERLNKRCPDANLQRRMASRLNQLIRFLGRGFKLRLKRRPASDVRHVTESEFRKLLPHIPEGMRLPCEVAFATGLRLGEVFAMTPAKLRAGTLPGVFVDRQMDETGTIRETKTRRDRTAVILSGWADRVTEWAAVPLEEKRRLREIRWASIVRQASLKAFPKDKTKRLVYHDLRHSYAIAMLIRGASISDVANLLGNSVVVAQMFYTGFAMTAEGIESLAKRLQAGTPT